MKYSFLVFTGLYTICLPRIWRKVQVSSIHRPGSAIKQVPLIHPASAIAAQMFSDKPGSKMNDCPVW